MRTHRPPSAAHAETQASEGNGLPDEASEGDIHAIGTLPTYDALCGSLQEGRLAVSLVEARLADAIQSGTQVSDDH